MKIKSNDLSVLDRMMLEKRAIEKHIRKEITKEELDKICGREIKFVKPIGLIKNDKH